MIDRTGCDVVADHSKWGVVSISRSPASIRYKLVVDDKFPATGNEAIAERKIEILVAGPPQST
jgi:hypothetical protein